MTIRSRWSRKVPIICYITGKVTQDGIGQDRTGYSGHERMEKDRIYNKGNVK